MQKNNVRLRIISFFDVFKPNGFLLWEALPTTVEVLEERGNKSPYLRQPSPPPPTASAGTTRGLLSTMTFWNVLSLVHSQWQAQPAASGTNITGRASQSRMPSMPGTASQQVKKTQVGPTRLIGQVLPVMADSGFAPSSFSAPQEARACSGCTTVVANESW